MRIIPIKNSGQMSRASSKKSKSKGKMSSKLKEETVEGYPAFKARLQQLEKEKPKGKVVFLFKGGENPDGSIWCKICVQVDELIEDFKKKHGPKGTLIRVKVGSIYDWGDDNSPFKKEPNKMAVTKVPTMIQWNTKARLEGIDEIGNIDKLKKLFD